MDHDSSEVARPHPSRLERRADSARSGSEQDRGRRRLIGLDLGRMVADEDFKPAVEYLVAIQSMRGGGGSLLFVRDADIDAMAEQDGRPVPEFLDRLDQLGVIVSSN